MLLLVAVVALPPTRRQCLAGAGVGAAANLLGGLDTLLEGSGTDGCEYGAVQWSNGLRAVVSNDPSRERGELALTVRCGWLADGAEFDGLAHLAEHVTLATDPQDLSGFIEQRVGELNAFTAEETTTFYLEFDLDGEASEEVLEVCRRFAALQKENPKSPNLKNLINFPNPKS
jgi:hypothetical protein